MTNESDTIEWKLTSWSWSTFTGRLRWKNGILEQEISVMDTKDGKPQGNRIEWLAVPDCES